LDHADEDGAGRRLLQKPLVEAVAGLVQEPRAVLLGQQCPAVEAVHKDTVAVGLVLHEEVARHAHAEDGQLEPLAHEHIHHAQTDRDAGLPLEDLAEVAVVDIVILVGIAGEFLLDEEVAVDGLDDLFAGRPTPSRSRTSSAMASSISTYGSTSRSG